MAVRNRWDDIKYLNNIDNPTIVDAGANEGRTIDEFIERFENPNIYAFEPVPELSSKLEEKYNDIEVYQKALGDQNMSKIFTINKNNATSSFLEPTKYNRSQHGEAVDSKRKIKIEQTRLDDMIDNVDILKLDLQGHELAALKGSERILENIDLITTETMFIEEYKNQPLFGDIDTFLRDRNFVLFNLYELSTHKNGRLDQADALYIKQNLLEGI